MIGRSLNQLAGGASARTLASSLLFVAAILASSVLIFIFGILGLHGNSIITASYLLVSLAGALLLGRREKDLQMMTPTDYVFGVFVVAVFISCILNFDLSDYKEYALLAIDSVLAYLVGRMISSALLSDIKFRLLEVSSLLVVAACIAIVPNLVGEVYARPFVFGFFHAASAFCIAFGYMTIAFIYSNIGWRSKMALFYFLLTAVATAIFVASTIRFVIIAILLTALFSFVCSIYRKIEIGIRIGLVCLAILIGILAGTVARYTHVVKISDQIAHSGSFFGIAGPDQNVVIAPSSTNRLSDYVGQAPSCNASFDMNNSIAIRRALLGDALYFLPKAGLFGFGLDLFSEMSCIHGYQIHNSLLQTFIEFGWGAGIALTILLVAPFWAFIRRRTVGPDMHFLLSCIAFATLLSMTYGQISRDLALFLFLGAFANLTAPRKSALVNNIGT